jgi:hypothetical protein
MKNIYQKIEMKLIAVTFFIVSPALLIYGLMR